jgi:hypothetical protein
MAREIAMQFVQQVDGETSHHESSAWVVAAIPVPMPNPELGSLRCFRSTLVCQCPWLPGGWTVLLQYQYLEYDSSIESFPAIIALVILCRLKLWHYQK